LIIIPGEARDPSYEGIVKGIGPDNFDVRVGDRVVFSRYAGIPLRETARGDGPTLALLDASEILAVHDNAVKPRKRVTYALDEQAVARATGIDDLNMDMIYIHWAQGARTVYVTFEEAQP
jgi:hypothetical protein